MERRLSVALTLAGVVGAVAWTGLAGRRTVPAAQVDAVLAELDGMVRETSAGVQARAVTLAQLPRLAWAVATDEATVRDLTTEELAFRPQAGEQIEIAQIEANDNRVRRLAGIPDRAASALTIPEPGLHLVVAGDDLRVTTVVKIEPKERGKIAAGLLGVAQRLDTSRVTALLTGKEIGARLQTRSGSLVLSRPPPKGSTRNVEMVLRSPAAEGAKLMLWVPVGIAWGHVTGAIVLVLISVVGGRLMARRAVRVPPPTPAAPELPRPVLAVPELPKSVPAEPELPKPVVRDLPRPSLARVPRTPTLDLPNPAMPDLPKPSMSTLPEPPPPETPGDTSDSQFFQSDDPTVVHSDEAAHSARNGQSFLADESMDDPTAVHPEDAAHSVRNGHSPPPMPMSGSGPTPVRQGHRPHAAFGGGESGAHHALSGAHPSAHGVQPSKPASLGVSGIVFAHGISMTMSSALFTGATGAEAHAAVPHPTDDAFDAEYRALFKEFVKLRRTCGESTEDLNRDRFVEVLHQKRGELMQRHGAKEVKFRLAFDNGRAAVRFKTVN